VKRGRQVIVGGGYHRRFLFAFVAFGLFVAAADRLQADLVTNLHPIADTGLLESNPDYNLGALTNVPCGTTPLGRSRALYKFDLTQLPTNATMSAASLLLNVTTVPGGGVGSIFALNRVLKDWGEGSGGPSLGGTPANTNEATWNDRFYPSAVWTTAGGTAGADFVNDLSSSNFVDAVGSYSFPATPLLVSDVQLWLTNPGTNFGWMLISQNEGTPFTVRRFATREDPVLTPVLTLHFLVPPEAVPPKISMMKVQSGQVGFSFDAESNRTYAVEYRDSLSAGSWQVLTNIPAQPVAALISISDDLNPGSRFYRVRTP
jgi:hypothetical protein